MADFGTSFLKISKDEGQWSNNESDPGGETYCGISRVNNPDWPGWIIIDSLHSSPLFPENLTINQDLKIAVRKLLKEKYWNVFLGDMIPSQNLADGLYDISVNIGSATCVIWLQIILTSLNRNNPAMFYPDLKPDGNMGKKTFAALLKFAVVEIRNINALTKDPYDLLCKMLDDRQSVCYQDLSFRHPEKRVDTRGWIKRT